MRGLICYLITALCIDSATSLSATLPPSRLPTIPSSPDALAGAAARSITASLAAGNKRQLVQIVVPLLESVRPEDIDPWPGGLEQMAPVVEPLARLMLQQVVGPVAGAPATIRAQTLGKEDACTLLLCQGASAAEDAACIIFAGCDQLPQVLEMEKVVGDRLLFLINPQVIVLRVASAGYPGACGAHLSHLRTPQPTLAVQSPGGLWVLPPRGGAARILPAAAAVGDQLRSRGDPGREHGLGAKEARASCNSKT